MAAAAAPARDGMAATIGKKELALALGWARTTLDRRLVSDPSFPVENRGDQAGGWAFDLKKVRTYLGDPGQPVAPAAKKTAPAIDKAQLRDAVKPPAASPAPPPSRRSAHHQGEATARQRKDAADASLRENKLRQENGELVDRSELRQALADVFASLASDLDGLPEAIAKDLNLPDASTRIRELIDKVRTAMVARAEPLVSDE